MRHFAAIGSDESTGERVTLREWFDSAPLHMAFHYGKEPCCSFCGTRNPLVSYGDAKWIPANAREWRFVFREIGTERFEVLACVECVGKNDSRSNRL